MRFALLLVGAILLLAAVLKRPYELMISEKARQEYREEHGIPDPEIKYGD